jgi:hypothetical protein
LTGGEKRLTEGIAMSLRWMLLLSILFNCPAAWAGTVRGAIAIDALPAPQPRPADAHFWHLPTRGRPQQAPPAAWVVLEGETATNLDRRDRPRPELTLKGYGIWPALQVARVGDRLRIVNRDDHPYSCRAEGGSGAFRLDALNAGAEKEQELLSAGVLQIRCDHYPFMRAVLVVTESPLVVRADAGGQFKLGEVPAGEYTARVFSAGEWRFESRVRVAAYGATRLELGPQTPPPADEGQPASDAGADAETPPAAEQPPPDKKPPPAQQPPVTKKPPAKKPPAKKPPAKKPPAKKPPAKKPPAKKPPAKKPPAKKPPAQEPQPRFEDVEPEIEIEIE